MIVELNGRCIEFPRPEKWVWYDDGYTILDLARYYTAVSPWLLPYLECRPVVSEAYPGTINGPHTFEQDPPPDAPQWVKRVKIPGRERMVTYVLVDSPATLVYLVSKFMVALHVWESTTPHIEYPDLFLVDLDPGAQCTLAQLARAALRVRNFFIECGIDQPLVKSSGARGLHVVSFVRPEYDYKVVRTLSQAFATELARQHPEQFTIEREPRARPAGAVYIDWGQVGRGMTIASPYSPRACDGAPVSMPLQWKEIERLALSRTKRAPIDYFRRYNLKTSVEILKSSGDPWAEHRAYSLTPLIAALRAPHDFSDTTRVRSSDG